MRKLAMLMFGLNILLLNHVYAEDDGGFSSGYVDYAYNTRHSLLIAPEVYQYKYEEPDLMELEGTYTGINLDYAYSILPDQNDESNPYGKTIKSFFVGVESRYAEGSVDYSSNGTGSMDDIDDYVVEVRPIVGFEARMTESVNVTPYLGFGYRYLDNDSSGRQTTTGHSGYERESNYYYLPLGARLAYLATPNTQIGASLEADIFLHGTQKSHLEDVEPSLYTVSNHQNSGYGLRASVFVEQDFKMLSVFVEPYVRYWKIDDSKLVVDYDYLVAFVEPKNSTIEAGLRVGVRF